MIAALDVETGRGLDDAIAGEFVGTGNLDIALLPDRDNDGVQVDVKASRTKHGEMLYPLPKWQVIQRLRRAVADMDAREAARYLRNQIGQSVSNAELLR